MVTYDQRLKTHLSRYKLERLQVQGDGVWKQNGNTYPHILPEELQGLNILETVRREFWAAFPGWQVQLHRDFHHLNSSQAMCFNLFFPFLQSGLADAKAMLAALGLPGERLSEWSFEFVPDKSEGTNFDFYLRADGYGDAAFEIKLSEREFGTAKADARHMEKLVSIYRPRLENLVHPEALEPGFFFGHYQLLRNLSYLSGEGRRFLYLVIPKSNKTLEPQLRRFRDLMLDGTKARVRVRFIEDLVPAFLRESQCIGARGIAHFELFAEKYLVTS